MYGVTEDEADKMVNKGIIGFGDVEEAFRRMSSEGGRFNDLMQKQAQSVGGLWSNLVDKITAEGERFGRDIEGMTKALIKALTTLVSFWPYVTFGFKSAFALLNGIV